MRMKTNAGKPIYRYSSDPDCTELSSLIGKLSVQNISLAERESILREIQELIENYFQAEKK